MGFWKDYAANIAARGYEDSDKSICAGCVGDRYLYNRIRTTGERSCCSFCGKRRNVLPMNDILEIISTVVKRDYLPAEGHAIYDSEEKQWMEGVHVLEPYDFVYDELNQYLESDSDEFLQELMDKLTFEERMPVFTFSDSQEKLDMMAWNEYCSLARSTPLSAEQIVGLIKPENKKNIPEDLEEIQATLEMVHDYCEELGLVKTIDGINSKKGGTPIYRCVNFLDCNQNYAGLSFIPATLVGTAPAKNVADSRMSEKGDMMFYGADDKRTSMLEVGRNEAHPDYRATMGTFYTNKKFRILDLSSISRDSLPSIFDVENEAKRSTWFFLNEFMERISRLKPKDSDDGSSTDDFYKPTQVFTKYIQRNTDLKGIKFKSSKSDGNCYVLFVVNRDCLDKGDKTDSSRNQLIMDKVEQIDFSDAG